MNEECIDCINSIFNGTKCIFFARISARDYSLVKADIMANIDFKSCNFFAPLYKVE